jgi:hypothetical protein
VLLVFFVAVLLNRKKCRITEMNRIRASAESAVQLLLFAMAWMNGWLFDFTLPALYSATVCSLANGAGVPTAAGPTDRQRPGFVASVGAASSALRIVSRTISPDMPGFYQALYTEPTGVRLRASAKVSDDNGRSWRTSPMAPDFNSGLPYGYRRAEITSLLDSTARSFITIVNALDQPGLDPKLNEPPIALQTYYLRYRVSSDGVNSLQFEEPMVQAGLYTPKHPFDGIWIGTNSIFLGDNGCLPILTRSGRILVPAQTTPLGPDGKLWNPTGGHTYTDALVLIGTWTNGHRLNWQASRRVRGDPKRSTRGLIEPTLAQFPDGRILMVMRGSNGGKADPNCALPSYKWMAVSRDDGDSWSSPEPWTCDDGKPFFSPSSMSTLFRHSSGRWFWAGNLTPENCRGNLPRWPLVIGEVANPSLKLIRASLLVVDTERTEDKSQGRLDLSHLTLLEDRENKEIILVYPRSHNAYQTREWATIRLAVQ